MSAQEIAKTVSFYNTVFDAVYLSTLFASLMLIAYGTYKLINDLTEDTPWRPISTFRSEIFIYPDLLGCFEAAEVDGF